MNHHAPYEPTHADLVAYLLDDLEGARAEFVAAHVAHCDVCAARLAALRRTLDQLGSLPVSDDADHRERTLLKARIQMEAAASRATRNWLQPVRAGLAAVALLLLVVVLAPALTGAGSPKIRDLIGIDPSLDGPSDRPRIVPGDRPFPTAAAVPTRATIELGELPFAPLMPASLPGDNQLTDVAAFASGSFEARYQGADGLILLVTQTPATGEGTRFSRGDGLEAVRIDDVDAYLLFNAGLNTVDLLTWVRGGGLFTLLSERASINDFPREEAFEVMRRLMELQDDPEALPGT